jgi:histone demethylase JARID1
MGKLGKQGLMATKTNYYTRLEALSNQTHTDRLPVSADTLADVDQILNKQREAQRYATSGNAHP